MSGEHKRGDLLRVVVPESGYHAREGVVVEVTTNPRSRYYKLDLDGDRMWFKDHEVERAAGATS